MATLVLRSTKGSPLTSTELDNNFNNLNSAKYESTTASPLGTPSSGTLTNCTGYTWANLAGTLNRLTLGPTGSQRSMFGQATLDLTTLNESTFYPVTIPLPQTRTVTLRIEVALNSGSFPTWSYHPNGFALFIEWTVNGSGYGTWNVLRTINGWTENWVNPGITIVGGITQMTNSSTEVIYLRGGGRYYFSADIDVTPVIRTASYTTTLETVAPSTTIINVPTNQGSANIGAGSLTLSGNAILGTASTDTLNVGNGGLVKDASGNVGIGTASPSGKLHVTGTSGNLLRVGTEAGNGSTDFWPVVIGDGVSAGSGGTNQNFVRIGRFTSGTAGIDAFQGGVGGAPLAFGTFGTERMRIDSNGNVGIGTTSPTQALEVTRSANSALIRTSNGTIHTLYGTSQFYSAGYLGTLNSYPFSFFTNDTERMRITATGGVGINTTQPLDNGLTVYNTNITSTKNFGNAAWNFAARALGTDQGQLGGYSFFPTFMGIPSDNGPRRAADIWSGFNGGQWGTQYLSFGVGGSVSNDLSDITAERMRITSAGNVGIGSTAPTQLLTLSSSTNFPFIHWNNSANTTIAFAGWHGGTSGGDDFRIGTQAAKAVTLQTNNTERMRIDASGNVGIGTTSPASKLHVGGSGANSWQSTLATGVDNLNLRLVSYNGDAGTASGTLQGKFGLAYNDFTTYADTALFKFYRGVGAADGFLTVVTNNTERMRIDASGNVGVGTTNPTARINIAAGTTAAGTAPLKFTSGTNLTTPEAGTVEYDGVVNYFTNDTVSGRGFTPTTQIFRLTAAGTTSSQATAATFFGANSAINLAANGVYEIEAYCYFLKTTNGTVTVTPTLTVAPANLNGTVQYGALVGGTASGTSNQINLIGSTAIATAFGPSSSLTGTANHLFIVKLIVEAGATAGNLRFNFTSATGTHQPLRGSYYKATRLPASNTGAFAT